MLSQVELCAVSPLGKAQLSEEKARHWGAFAAEVALGILEFALSRSKVYFFAKGRFQSLDS